MRFLQFVAGGPILARERRPNAWPFREEAVQLLEESQFTQEEVQLHAVGE